MTSGLPDEFDRGKRFYPLVVNYLVSLSGYKDLAVRGILDSDQRAYLIGIIEDLGTPSNVPEDTASDIRNKLGNVLGPLKLQSEHKGRPIEFSVDTLSVELSNHFEHLSSAALVSYGAILIIAHEIIKDSSFHDKSPILEFLRHCRNAAAHGGAFSLIGNEPRRTAEWGALKIQKSTNGLPLFKRGGDHGMLSPGDPIWLLLEIEKQYPQMVS